MALIECDECGVKISDKSSSCPKCGNPNPILQAERKAEKRRADKKIGCTIELCCILGGIFLIYTKFNPDLTFSIIAGGLLGWFVAMIITALTGKHGLWD